MKIISPLTPDDFANAFIIENQCHSHPWSEKTFLSNQGDSYLNLKIEQDNQLVGFAITHVVLDEATLFNVAITPTHQKQGLAKALLEHLSEKLRERGVITLWLEVRASNIKAINLYHALGFNQVTIRHGYYPAKNGREDAIIMALYL